MSYTIHHPKLGEVQVLIEAEIDHASSTGATARTVEGVKHFALVKATSTPKVDGWRKHVQFKRRISRLGKVVDHHYVLWGNTAELFEMGITHLVTPGLKPVKGSRPVNLFFQMIRSSEFMTFIKK